MGSNRQESYFDTVDYEGKTYGIVDCYDGHSIDAKTLKEMSKNGYKEFYNVEDGCYSEYYVICSHKKLTKSEVDEIDQHLAGENE